MKGFSLAELRNRFRSFTVELRSKGSVEQSIPLSSEELFQALTQTEGNNKLLGLYDEEQVAGALQRYGVWKTLEELGYPSPKLKIQSLDPFRQRLRIFTSQDVAETDETLLCELRVFDAWLKGDCPISGRHFEINALVIDWLLFQNPNASFTADRPPLPGQRFPGLGIMRTSMRAIIDLAKQEGKEAVVNIPEYYHNAVLYAPDFRFFSPFVEGRFQALRKFLSNVSLTEASHLVMSEKLRNETKQEPFRWKAHEQVLGLVPEISEYFTSEPYLRGVAQAENESRFSRLL